MDSSAAAITIPGHPGNGPGANLGVTLRLTSGMQSETGLPLDLYEVLLDLDESPDVRLRMNRLADSMLLSAGAS